MGIPPLTYQWYFNGTPIEGATGSSYTIDGMSAKEGAYTVEIQRQPATQPVW